MANSTHKVIALCIAVTIIALVWLITWGCIQGAKTNTRKNIAHYEACKTITDDIQRTICLTK